MAKEIRFEVVTSTKKLLLHINDTHWIELGNFMVKEKPYERLEFSLTGDALAHFNKLMLKAIASNL